MKKYLIISAIILMSCGYSAELLQNEVERDLSCICHPNRKWVEPRSTIAGEEILDVAIIGGGQTGLTMAFSLTQHNVDNIRVFDKNKEGFAGSWVNIGRMRTLRTPKTTAGPELGIPVLSVKSWFTEKYSADEWEKLDYIPRLDWHDYLNWFRKVLDLPVQFESEVGPLNWDEANQCFSFLVTNKESSETIYARKVILAVGLEGSGEWMIPDFVKKNVSEDYYSQAIYQIPYEKMKDKKIAILGAGPNAFDLTLEASKAGAKSITMFSKRDKLVNLHCFKWGEFTGFMKCFTDLNDGQKYSFIARMHDMGQPPVPGCVFAAYKLPNFKINFLSPWENAYQNGDVVTVETAKGQENFDFLIIATGWVCDLSCRPEIKNFYEEIATWGDCYQPPENLRYEKLMKFPYLGRGFQFTEKEPGRAPYVNSIFNMTGGGLLSNGFCAGTGLTGMKYSIDLATHEIVKQLFLEDADSVYGSLDTYDVQDFQN